MKLRLTSALVVLISASSLTGCGRGEPQGPVEVAESLVYYPHLKVGDVITDGAIQLTVAKGVGTPVIDAVRNLDTSPGLRYLGAYAAGPHRKWGFNEMVHGFPPKQPGFGPIRPIVGARVTPGQPGAELLMGYELVVPGYQARPHVEVDYHIGDRHYRLVAQVGVANCPRHWGFHRCDARFSSENPWW